MRQTTATHKTVRLNHPTIDGWLNLFGGPGFKAKRTTEAVKFILTAI